METHHAVLVHSLTNHCVQASHPHLESSFRVCERETVSAKRSLVRDTDRKGVEQFFCVLARVLVVRTKIYVPAVC